MIDQTGATTGQQDPAATGTDPAATQTGGQPDVGRTFTQADVDAVVKDRLARAKRSTAEKYADYDALKASAAKLAEIEEANKTEAEKVLGRIEAAEAALAESKADNERLAQERTDALIQSSVVAKATALGFRDPADAVSMLDMTALTLQDDGTVEGADEALTALSEAKPYLLTDTAPHPRLGPTAPGRASAQSGETDAQKRARIYGGPVSDPFSGEGGGYIPFGGGAGD